MTHPIITAIEERRTTVLFDPSRDISNEQITESPLTVIVCGHPPQENRPHI